VRHRWADRLVIDPDQETNDLTKAVRHCLALGHSDLTLLGATGRREDHALANIALLMDYADLLPLPLGAPPCIRMVSDFGTFYPCRDQITLSVEVGQEVSIFSFGATHFSAQGLQYPLYDFDRLWQGTLNVATRPEVRIDACGPFCVYVALPD
jgi:thiamine diphosphokinase